MKSFPIVKIDLQLDANNLKGKSEKELENYIKSDISALILHILTSKPKDGDIHAECHTDNHGNSGCSGGFKINL